ncbi:cis-zeatin O-beta-D-glucosyltransferase [Ranunculus cassubicifolius]
MVHQDSTGGVAVVMVPLPAQGHLNQLLHLTRIISTSGLPVHFLGAATHNRQAKDRVHGWDPSTISNIQFHDCEFPEFPTPPPDPKSAYNFPAHLMPTFYASVKYLRDPLGRLLRELGSTHRRVVVVHDGLMSFAAHEASLLSNAEAYCFDACSAFAVLHYIWEALGKPADEEGKLFPKDIPFRTSFGGCTSDDFPEFSAQNLKWLDYRAGDIYNTCNAIEDRFITLLAPFQADKKVWAIGPFNPIAFDSELSPKHECLEWLDKQPPNSVIYVSFGTMTSVSDDQIAELAFGLERSEQRFLWVLRDADLGDIYKGSDEVRKNQLPEGFEDRIKGIGLIVRDWAPQVQILAHSSIGGFMSHCGWNSSMESLSMGVPIAAWPMHSDQPRNALLITEVLKVGLMVRKWADRDELVLAETIEGSIRTLMASDEGCILRKRAYELGVEVRRAVSEDGTSTTQLESFLSHILR